MRYENVRDAIHEALRGTRYNNITEIDNAVYEALYVSHEAETHIETHDAHGPYGSLQELRDAYDLSELSTVEIKELIETFVSV